jgi:TetR/AcrR family transcriptional regulator, ethionamide resistance regulator
VQDRHRRRRGTTRRRILDAALELLEARRWHDIRLEDVMIETGLTRTAFYRHFADREALLLALLEDAGLGLDAAGLAWKQGAGDPVEQLRAGLGELTAVLVRRGRLFQAVVDSAAQEAAVAEAHAALVERMVAVTAERIGADAAAGRSAVEDADETARALVHMSESYLLAAFGRPPFPDADRIAATLAHIWVAAIYGGVPSR